MKTRLGAVRSWKQSGTQVLEYQRFTFTATFGVIAALLGTIKTVNVPGLKVGDIITLQCTSSPPAGMVIANARVSAADTLEISFTTAIALGLTLGSLNFAGMAYR